MKRDKQISMKVNSDLIDKFNAIVAKFTTRLDWGYKVYYRCEFPDKQHYVFAKYSLADLFENALKDFIEKYEDLSAVKSDTN